MSEGDSGVSIAVVLAGGGARGAYEAGALSVLLPVLEQRGERPRIVIGTSVGAVTASYLAANAHLAADELVAQALTVWGSVRWEQVVRPLISPASVIRLSEYAGEVLGLPGAHLESLLDPEPLSATLRERLDFRQLERNVQGGSLDVAGVVATSSLTGRSVVFRAGGHSPPRDHRRGIDYVRTMLAEDHILASAAIPAIFPAVRVEQPTVARGWYFDGGTRLNTPIKPALEFGTQRVMAVAPSSFAPAPTRLAGEERPDALEAAGQILLGLLEDQLSADVQTLATINGLTRATRVVRGRKRRVPYILIAPTGQEAIGARAQRVIRERYSGTLQAIRSPDIALLERLIAGGADARHAELLSFLLFAPEFTSALIRLGEEDANRWVNEPHDFDDLWQIS